MLAKLSDGFEVQMCEDCFNDWRFLTTLRKIDKGETGLIVDVAEKILGSEEEVEKLATHLEKDGVTHTDDMIAAITELMESVNDVKK